MSSKMSSSSNNNNLSTSQQQQQQQLTISSNPYLTTLATIATAAAQQQQQHQFAAVAALALQQQLAAVTGGDPMSFAAANPLLGTFCTSPTGTSTNAMSSVSQLYTSVNPANGRRGTVQYSTVRAPTLQLASTGRYFAPPTQTLIPTLAVAQPTLVPVPAPTIPKQPEGPDGANLFIYHLPGMCQTYVGSNYWYSVLSITD